MGKDSLEKAAGSGVTVKLKGKEFELKPFTIGDYVALRSQIKSQRIQEFLDSAANLPSEDKTKVLTELSSQVISEEDLVLEANSPSGMLFMFLRMLRRSDPTITLEDLDEYLTEENMEELSSLAFGLNEDGETKDPLAEEEIA